MYKKINKETDTANNKQYHRLAYSLSRLINTFNSNRIFTSIQRDLKIIIILAYTHGKI